MTVREPVRSHDFYEALGMRSVWRGDDMAILELRGGTHLLCFRGDPERGDAPFDLMVEDLDAAHRRLSDLGVDVSDISRGDIHDTFVVTDPDGVRVQVSNSHVEGPV